MKRPTAVIATVLFAASMAAAYLWQALDSRRDDGGRTLLASEPEATPPAAAPEAPTGVLVPGTSPAVPEPLVPPAAPAAALAAFEQGRPARIAVLDEMSAQARSRLSELYADLAHELGLSADDASRFLDLLAEQQQQLTRLLSAQSQEGRTPEQIRLETYDRIKQDEREQAAMLGARYPQWPLYQARVSFRPRINEFRNRLGRGENALTDAQFRSLEAAISAEIPQITREHRDRLMSGPALMAESSRSALAENVADRNRRLVRVASSHLTGAQLEVFSQVIWEAR